MIAFVVLASTSVIAYNYFYVVGIIKVRSLSEYGVYKIICYL